MLKRSFIFVQHHVEFQDAHLLHSLQYFRTESELYRKKLEQLIGPIHRAGAEIGALKVRNAELIKAEQEARAHIEVLEKRNGESSKVEQEARAEVEGLKKRNEELIRAVQQARYMLALTTRKLSLSAGLLKVLKHWGIEFDEGTTRDQFFLQVFNLLTEEGFVQNFL